MTALAFGGLATALASGTLFNAISAATDSTPPRIRSARIVSGAHRPVLRIDVSERVALNASVTGPGRDRLVRRDLRGGASRVALAPGSDRMLAAGSYRVRLTVTDRGDAKAHRTLVLRVPR